MDVTNTTCKSVYAQVSEHFALFRIGKFTGVGNAVFGAANAANFCLNRNTLLVANSNNFLCTLKVKFKIMLA